MTYQQYTHNIVVKNSEEILTNHGITCDMDSGLVINYCPNQAQTQNKPTIAVPGFINLHTHLAYTNVKLKPQPLFLWLKELLAQESSPQKNIQTGIQQALNYGTSFVVENTNYPELSYQELKQSGIKSLIGIEIFGSDPDKAEDIFARTINTLDTLEENSKLSLTLSPHASYDVSPKLWKLAQNWCQQNNKLLLSHCAESPAEEAWFRDKNSKEAQSAKEFWASIQSLEPKLKHWQAYRSSVDFLEQNNLLNKSSLLTHMVQTDQNDLEQIKKYKAKLITCPRSNEFLQNGKAAIQDWINLGIEFGIGTDSKASNYSLDLREEIKALEELDSKSKFNKLTIDAAKILGLESEIGSLDLGKAADFVVLEATQTLPDLQNCDLFALILDTEFCRVKELYINGHLKKG